MNGRSKRKTKTKLETLARPDGRQNSKACDVPTKKKIPLA